jgi:nucleoside-diphosphate-sugar epimerase
VNSIGTAHAVSWADSIGAKVLFASTSEIYGDPDVSPQPETYWGNVNTYGIRSCYDEAKRFGESWIHTSNIKNKTRHGIIRIFNTYGPRMNPSDGRVIINFLVSALRNEPITMYGDGSQTRSFCFIDDLVSGVLAYLKADQVEPINLGNDKEFSILQLTEIIRGMFPERKIDLKRLPLPADDPRQRRPDLTRARERLGGWQPTIPLSEGLEKMRHWLETDAEIPAGWKP